MAKKKGTRKTEDKSVVADLLAEPPVASGGKRPIESYTHGGQQRVNNPPVGLVTPITDPPEPPRQRYEFDPHLDPQLVWSGKAERTSFEVPTVSLHVHERIDPKTIIAAVRTNGHHAAASDAIETLSGPLSPASGERARVRGRSKVDPASPPHPDPHPRSGGEGESRRPTLRQRSLFEEPEENPPLRDALDFYKHPHGWSNRLIAGDSLLVMNSLLEKEGLAGKVQMIYLDPPYGIRYGSNFQPFVNKRDVKDGKDEDLTQEPETIKAFRDTWELGIHSYLTTLRDRLLLARELLTESGSIFVQISDANLHHIREMMDEIFGVSNFLSVISVRKTTSQGTATLLGATTDFIIWYGKDRSLTKYRQLYLERSDEADDRYDQALLPDGRVVRVGSVTETDLNARLFQLDNLTSSRPSGPGDVTDFEFEGVRYSPRKGTFKTHRDGLVRLVHAGRLQPSGGGTLRYRRFKDDFPLSMIGNLWYDISGAVQSRSDPKVYVVQSSTEIISRSLLMTTDPGDLVFDPTCGSGTTAFVAETWGRRWITCDTSRVAVTLAKQRLMTAVYDYYKLPDPSRGVAGGFVCKTVPHITLKSIANNPDIREGLTRQQIDAAIRKHAEPETLHDQPEIDRSKARVSGPFTVEAVPAPSVMPVDDVDVGRASQPVVGGDDGLGRPSYGDADASIARSGLTIRHTEWRDELSRCGVRGRQGQRIEFTRLEPLPGLRFLHAAGETRSQGSGVRGQGSEGQGSKRVVVSFGPEHAPLEQRQVEQAWDEARTLSPKPEVLLFAAFQFDPEAAKDIDHLTPEKTGMIFLKLQMNTDLLTEDLKKKRSSNESFWLMGQPDVTIKKIHRGQDTGLWQAEVHGFDYYNPKTGKIESGDTERIALWLLDPDYDGRSLFPRQVFFPMSSDKDGWARLAKNLKAEIDEELIEAYRGTVSLPFELGKHRRVAVKIVDDRGIESLKVVTIEP